MIIEIFLFNIIFIVEQRAVQKSDSVRLTNAPGDLRTHQTTETKLKTHSRHNSFIR